MKTRLQILQDDRDSALEQHIGNEINVLALEKRIAKLNPGNDAKDIESMKEKVNQMKTAMENIAIAIESIDELMTKEVKGMEEKN